MFLIDTNILLHAVNRESADSQKTSAFLRALPKQSECWGLSWNVLYEFMRVATHPRVFSAPLTQPQAWQFISALLNCPNCMLVSETGLHAETLAECAEKTPRLGGNILHDFHTAVLMREHGITEIVTFDQDFRAFPWITIKELDT
ncbi:type II toxin-antitoxin system VapC family toxin [Kiritimatiella glycovorans]|uniref:Ribonuclease VapC n=1 Tax=Kiritimatiella glycovorans TaxID=1307763 RepID=A0A0G3EFK5_9BACT|nr:TA system VapC family ribonuclease toxin [Kiritimatiella glycovorans]AKJ64187.1 putative ribonuclease VapC37 [Kiritimatiella glycovorans]